MHQLLRDPDRDADPGEARRRRVSARARRRIPRRRIGRCRWQSRDDAAAAQSAGGERKAPTDATTPAPAGNPIKNDKDIDQYQHVFANTEYWKKIGEEYQQPLIVTGTVLFTSREQTQMQQREQEVFDTLGRRRTVAERRLVERKGFGLQGRFIFIDGRQTPALSSYFELMDKLIPNFLATLSSQKIKGTRILLN
jgi:hypothetical protein